MTFLAAAIAALALGAPASAPDAIAVLRPHIVQSPIPFGARRRRHPHVIVEHYTANDSYAATWSTFAADVRDPELHELPGTCAHFVIDRSGRIHQLVRLRWRCRHT